MITATAPAQGVVDLPFELAVERSQPTEQPAQEVAP
jgi:hypothetical protein